MNAKVLIRDGAAGGRRLAGGAKAGGLAWARALARGGRLISAIKNLEAVNPDLPRDTARAIVDSFGYGRESRWPELEKNPEERGQAIQSL